jgi:hypothetical protein
MQTITKIGSRMINVIFAISLNPVLLIPFQGGEEVQIMPSSPTFPDSCSNQIGCITPCSLGNTPFWRNKTLLPAANPVGA